VRQGENPGICAVVGLILTFMTFTLPFAIWMLIGYLDSIPRELDEAALVDGNGPLGALFRVVVPAAIPGIVAVAIYAFMTAWGEVLFASVITDDTTPTLCCRPAWIRHPEQRVREPDHGSLTGRERAHRRRFPVVAALHGRWHDRRVIQVRWVGVANRCVGPLELSWRSSSPG
jgi:Binding-protein-dependent transport system inner membrane component